MIQAAFGRLFRSRDRSQRSQTTTVPGNGRPFPKNRERRKSLNCKVFNNSNVIIYRSHSQKAGNGQKLSQAIDLQGLFCRSQIPSRIQGPGTGRAKPPPVPIPGFLRNFWE